MALGTIASDRITASPRKMCVPGVQAYATDGNTTIAMAAAIVRRATMLRRSRAARGGFRAGEMASDPETSTLAPHGATQIAQLRADRIIDRVARPAQVVLDLCLHRVDGNVIPELASALTRPAAALGPHSRRAPSRPC